MGPHEGSKLAAFREGEYHGVMETAPVCFYVPQRFVPANGLPAQVSEYWKWRLDRDPRETAFDQSGKFDWTLYTYLQLREHGLECSLVHDIPDRGIVVAHRDFLPNDVRPGRRVLLVCIQADRTTHPYAQLHVVQNPIAARSSWRLWWKRRYIPFWSQPSLLPRDGQRGERFENVAYFGLDYNLAPELRSDGFATAVASLGLQFKIVPKVRWHDYREVDAVIAIRSFDGARFLRKPATKLVNAWRAGVPAIVGQESSFGVLGNDGIDFISAASPTDAIEHLRSLRDDPVMRAAIVENGKRHAEQFDDATIRSVWREFLLGECATAHARWVNTSEVRRTISHLTCDIDRVSRWTIRAMGDRLIKNSELRRAYLIGDVASFAHGIRRAIAKARWR